MSLNSEAKKIEELDVGLERDSFMRTLIRELAGTLTDVVGLPEASGFMSVVGQHMGKQINAQYRQALHVSRLTRPQVTAVMVDLKRRIRGDFYVISEAEDHVVLGNRACPFGGQVHGRPALCMMTSNVFGSIAADNLGYAKVELKQTIAEGHQGCRIVIYFEPTPQSRDAKGRE